MILEYFLRFLCWNWFQDLEEEDFSVNFEECRTSTSREFSKSFRMMAALGRRRSFARSVLPLDLCRWWRSFSEQGWMLPGLTSHTVRTSITWRCWTISGRQCTTHRFCALSCSIPRSTTCLLSFSFVLYYKISHLHWLFVLLAQFMILCFELNVEPRLFGDWFLRILTPLWTLKMNAGNLPINQGPCIWITCVASDSFFITIYR